MENQLSQNLSVDVTEKKCGLFGGPEWPTIYLYDYDSKILRPNPNSRAYIDYQSNIQSSVLQALHASRSQIGGVSVEDIGLFQ